jgi:hypothetical protein
MYGFVAVNDAFKAEVLSLAGYLRIQGLDRTGLAKSKGERRADLEIFGTEMCANAMAYAVEIENVVLFEEVNYKIGAFSRFSETRLVIICEIVLEKVNEHLDGLADFGITALRVADFQASINRFAQAKPKPTGGRQTKKFATEQIKEGFKRADGHLKKMDGLAKCLEFSEPEFYRNYCISRKIDGTARRMIKCRGRIVDQAGAPVPFVLMTCETLGLKRKTTKNGTFRMQNALDGPHLITFSRPNFETVVQEISFYQGERTEVVVVMRAL